MRRFGIPLLVALTLLLAATLPPRSEAAKTKKSRKDVILAAEFPEVPDAHRALTEVPYAKGAPAVILLEAQQNDWHGLEFRRIRYLRRIKILSPAGVEQYGDFAYHLVGGWRVQKIQARTILPDGTAIDASDSVFKEKSEDLEYQVLKVAFPRVEAGAILDLMIDLNADHLVLEPWIAQGEIPVLESRFTILPPPGLQFFPMAFPPEVSAPEEITFGNKNGYVWTFLNVPPLPDAAFMLPAAEIAQRLVVVLLAYKDSSTYFAIATDWKQFSKRRHEWWNEWIDKRNRNAQELARQVAGEAGNNLAKAEAIRQVVRQRVTSEYSFDYPLHASPDEVLERGFGASADLAGLTVAMLRAVDVKADLLAIRRRGGGRIPLDRPVPALLDEVLVRLPGSPPVYFSPAAALPVGKLPWDCTGVAGIPLDGRSDSIVLIPDLTADDNATLRKATARLHPDGRLTGESAHTFRGSVADRWRRRMGPLDDEKRRERFSQELGRHMEGIQVKSVSLEQLDGVGDEFVVKASWEVAGYAAQAGSRLIVNPNIFSRQTAAGWGDAARVQPIELGMAFDDQDSVTIELPEGVGKVDLPGAANVNVGAAGFFKAGYQRQGAAIVAERHMRLNMPTFAPENYGVLSQWFTAAATSDDRPLVVNLAP